MSLVQLLWQYWPGTEVCVASKACTCLGRWEDAGVSLLYELSKVTQ